MLRLNDEDDTLFSVKQHFDQCDLWSRLMGHDNIK